MSPSVSRAAWLALAAAAVAGCSTFDDVSKTPIKPRYAVSADASDACVDAARRASRWCVEQTVNAEEGTWGQRCTKAQWDYHNLCH